MPELWCPVPGFAHGTNKPLRLAAIKAMGTICPLDSVEILANLTDSEDEDIAETAGEAMSTAEWMLVDGSDDEEFDDDGDDEEGDDEEPGSGSRESIH